jgi:hypothetical protein
MRTLGLPFYRGGGLKVIAKRGRRATSSLSLAWKVQPRRVGLAGNRNSPWLSVGPSTQACTTVVCSAVSQRASATSGTSSATTVVPREPGPTPAVVHAVVGVRRSWFAGLPESRQRGYQAGRFSFNVKGGRCEACQGDGLIKI